MRRGGNRDAGTGVVGASMSSTSTAAACTCARRAWVAQVGKGGRAGGGAGERAEGRSPLCSAEAAEFLWKRRSLAPRQVAGALRSRTPRVGRTGQATHRGGRWRTTPWVPGSWPVVLRQLILRRGARPPWGTSQPRRRPVRAAANPSPSYPVACSC